MRFARTRLALHWIWRQVLTCALIALLLLAVYVGVGRQLMPLVGDYKGRLEAQLSAQAGVTVRIGGLRGEWDGLTPIFIVSNIEIRDPHHPEQLLTRLPQLMTRPAIMASLLSREPRLSTTLEGLSLHLQQQPDGRIQVAELSSLESADPKAAHQAIGLLMRQPSLVLRDSLITLNLSDKPALVMSDLNVTSLNEGTRHWLKGSFRIPHNRDTVSLILKYQGDPLDWRQGRLQTWMNLPVMDMGAWLQLLPLPDLAVKNASLGGQFWLDFQQGSLSSVVGQMTLPQADLTAGGDPYIARGISGLLGWQREPAGWVATAEHLTGSLNAHALPAPRLALRSRDRYLELTTAQLAIAPLRDLLLGNNRLPAAARSWLTGLAPTGWVPHLRLSAFRQDDGSLGGPAVTAEFKAVTLKAHGAVPAVSQLAGWLNLNDRGGLAYIDSRNSVLELKSWFHEPLLADSVSGGFRITRSDTDWQIDSSLLHISNPDATGSALLSLSIPVQNPAAARMNLLASLHQAKAASAWRYVPYPVAGEATLAWLKAAITAGTVDSGSFLYDGPLGHVRGEPDGRLQMHFQAHDISLAYLPGWPPVEGLSGGLTIDGSVLTATASQSHVYGTSASDATATIADLSHPVLVVSALLKGPAADALRLFKESPLREQVGSVPAVLGVDGQVSGHLDLQVPFDERPVRVDVEADLPGNTLRLPKQDLQVDDARGQISYSSSQGLVSHHLLGRLFDEPVEAHIVSQMRGDTLSLVHITVEGHAGVPALQRWSGASLFKYLEGGSSYQADILIPGDSSQNGQLLISAPLDGLKVNLPAPFGKGTEPMPLRYQSDIGEGELNARLSIGRRLSVGLLWENGRLKGASVHAGEGNAAESKAGIALDLHVNRLNVSEWQEWLAQPGNAGGSDAPPLTRLVLDANELEAKGYKLHNAHVDAHRDGDNWNVAVKSERLDGNASFTANGKTPVTVNIDRLEWPLPEQADTGKSDTGGEDLSVPVLLHIKSLGFDRWKLKPSDLALRVTSTPYGLHVDQIFLTNPIFSFTGALNWNWRSGPRTHLTGTLTSSDAAELLTELGYTPLIESSAMNATVTDLNWAGGPGDFGVDSLNGHISAWSCADAKTKTGGGKLLNLGVAASASRLFGLFDIDNLKDRLQFKFSDVTRKGVSFDRGSMRADLVGGVMQTSNFAFTGPSMSASGNGTVNLNTEDVDQQISVSVPVSSVLLVVGGVLAGPLGVVAGTVAKETLDKQLSKLTTVHYHVSGNWNQPQVARGNATTGNDRADADPVCSAQ